jgi:uncharacterized protein YkwD
MAAMMRKRHLAALLLALGAAACARESEPQPARVVESRVADTPARRGLALLRRVMLDRQNAARAEVGVAPLVWSDDLAASASAYAQELARTGRFAHAVQPLGAGRQGENLWMGTHLAYSYDEMVGGWLAERRDFVNGAAPDFSRTGRWQDVGHYAQVVWQGSTAVGCAVASNRTNDYLVCRYSPPGNVVGQRAF